MARRYIKVIFVYKINHVSKFIFFFSLNSSIKKYSFTSKRYFYWGSMYKKLKRKLYNIIRETVCLSTVILLVNYETWKVGIGRSIIDY